MSQSNCMFINPEKPQRHTYIHLSIPRHTQTQCQDMCGCHSGVTEDSILLGRDAVSLYMWSPTFWKNSYPLTRNHSPNNTVSHPNGLESSHMLNVRCEMCAVQRLHSPTALTLSPPSWSWLSGDVARLSGGLAELNLDKLRVSYLWDLSVFSGRIDRL